jgi:hypothetical protein
VSVRTRTRVRATSARARVHARGDLHLRIRTAASTGKTASVGKIVSARKCGRGRTSGRTFSSKNVCYDIPGWYYELFIKNLLFLEVFIIEKKFSIFRKFFQYIGGQPIP